MANKAPWTDYKGRDLYEGDTIIHPVSGQKGIITYHLHRGDPTDCWCVDYGSNFESRLCLQIGDKGQAVKYTHNKELEKGNEKSL